MKLIYLEWEDAVSNEEVSWKIIEEAKNWAKEREWLVKQCGWLIEENKKYIVLASRMEPGNENSYASVGLLQKVPKTWIRKRVDLTNYIK